MATRAILFDLGNTLVGYYTPSEFPLVLRRCLRECARALGQSEDPARDEDLFERALLLNREPSDYAVRPLAARLQELFGAYESLDEVSARALGAAFLKPIFATWATTTAGTSSVLRTPVSVRFFSNRMCRSPGPTI